LDQFQPFGEASRFTSAIERSGKMEGKIATLWPQFVRLKEVHQCIRMRATLSNTLLAWAGWDQFQPFATSQSFY
jgi:hypothetical protein